MILNSPSILFQTFLIFHPPSALFKKFRFLILLAHYPKMFDPFSIIKNFVEKKKLKKNFVEKKKKFQKNFYGKKKFRKKIEE